MQYNKQPGFIALMSVIIILAVLLVISASISFTGFFTRFNVSDAEYKKRSSALAEACVDVAKLKLANNIDYVLTAADHNISVTGSDTCNIVSLQPSPPRTGQITIMTQAVFPLSQPQQSYTNLTVVASSTDLSTISWYETPN